MNCVEFWNEAERQPHRTSERDGHLAECPMCAARWKRQSALLTGLRALADDWRAVEAPLRVEGGLRAAFRVQAGGRRPVYRSGWAPVVLWASAAAATFTLALALMHPARLPVFSPGESASPHHGAVAPAETAAAEDSLDLENDFVPVPNAARIEPNEDVSLVRVEVPRSAMMAMGISVNSENASETVLADVVLGADGMARAVRLVADGPVLEE
jgi:hypothetical protein